MKQGFLLCFCAHGDKVFSFVENETLVWSGQQWMSVEDTVAVLMEPSAVFSGLTYVFNSISVLLTKAGMIKPLDIFTVNILALHFLNAGVALVNGSDLA